MKRVAPAGLWRIAVLLLLPVTGLSALGAGYSFMADPTGRGMGMATSYLRYSPFADYRIPGMVLFLCIGVCCHVVLALVLMRSRHYPPAVGIQGLILVAWILVQMAMVRDVNGLHVLCLAAGGVLAAAGYRLAGKARRTL